MSWKTTMVLIVLAAAGGGWFLYRDLGPGGRTASTPESEAMAELRRDLQANRLTRIEIVRPDERITFQFDNGWSLEGGWPARSDEVQQVVNALKGLQSRFEPIELAHSDDVARFGLRRDQQPVQVNVTLRGPEGQPVRHTLLFGEPAEFAGNPFSRPTYMRLDSSSEIVRMAPGVKALLNRSRQTYFKRQLFPETERVKLDAARPAFPGEPDAAAPILLLLDAKQISMNRPEGSWTLRRIGTRSAAARADTAVEMTPEKLSARWELAAPVVDRVDPERLRGVLAAVPELWVEQFADADAAKTGLDNPERTVAVEFDDRPPVKLLIGKVSRVVEKKPPSPPANPLTPPPPALPAVREEYRYAKIPDHPQVFEVRADRLTEAFPAIAALRDAKLFRFPAAQVRRVELVRSAERFVMTKTDGRWRIAEPTPADADPARVAELVDRMVELQATGRDVVDGADLKAIALDPATTLPHLTVTMAGDDKAETVETHTLWVGKHDDKTQRVAVQVAGNPRVSWVGADFLRMFDRPAVAYRNRRVLDVAPAQVASIAVARAQDGYELKRAENAWSLTSPVAAPADAGKANLLAADLSRLDAVEYITDAPKPDDLTRMGLDAARASATMTFADGSAAKTLLLGANREGKPEAYARFTDAPLVFTVKAGLRDAISQSSLNFRPLVVWSLPSESIDSFEIAKGRDDPLRATRSGAAWKLSSPFDSAGSAEALQPLVAALATVRAERWESHAATDLARYGLDRPVLRATVQGTSTLLIGAPAGGSTPGRFAKTADSNAVFVVPDALFVAVDRPPIELVDRRLLSVQPDRVTEIRGTGPDGDWAIARSGDQWVATSLKTPAPADRTVVGNLLRALSDVQATRFVEFGSRVLWERYGLDRPTATITVVADGAAPQTLSIAAPTREGEPAFARLESSHGVAEIPAALAKQLTHGDLDFVSRDLWTMDPVQVTAIRRLGGDELELERTADGWAIAKPAGLGDADRAGIDALVGRLAGLRASKIVDLDAQNPDKYGLGAGSARISVLLKSPDGAVSEKAIEIGRTVASRYNEPDGSRYVRVEGSPIVGILTPAIAQPLTREAWTLRDRTLARFSDADRAIVERGPRRSVFVRQDGQWKMSEPISADAEQTELNDLINAVSRLRADEFVAARPTDLRKYGLDTPEAQWRFISQDRDALNLLVGVKEAASDRRYAKLANTEAVFLLDASLSNRLVADYRQRAVWPAVDPAQIETLIVTVGDKTVVFQRTNAGWQIPSKPDQAVNAAAVNETAATLAGLKAERYVVDKDADPRQYGLQPPRRSIVCQARNAKPLTLYLGTAERGSSRVFARVFDPARSDVFMLSEGDSAKLQRDLNELVGR